MAFDMNKWLAKMRAEEGANGPLYSDETLQDFVSLVLLTNQESFDTLPIALTRLLGAFLLRSGLEGKQGPELEGSLKKYFEATPLPTSLIERFQVEFKRDPSALRPLRTFRA